MKNFLENIQNEFLKEGYVYYIEKSIYTTFNVGTTAINTHPPKVTGPLNRPCMTELSDMPRVCFCSLNLSFDRGGGGSYSGY